MSAYPVACSKSLITPDRGRLPEQPLTAHFYTNDQTFRNSSMCLSCFYLILLLSLLYLQFVISTAIIFMRSLKLNETANVDL